MKIDLEITGDIKKLMEDEKHKMGIATTTALHIAGQTLKQRWRQQVVSAGLGTRLGNTIRFDPYPRTGFRRTRLPPMWRRSRPG